MSLRLGLDMRGFYLHHYTHRLLRIGLLGFIGELLAGIRLGRGLVCGSLRSPAVRLLLALLGIG